MILENQLEGALQSPQPVQNLRTLVVEMMSKGKDKTSILKSLEEARLQMRNEGREKEEDVVLDVMDFLTGFCSPHMKIG